MTHANVRHVRDGRAVRGAAWLVVDMLALVTVASRVCSRVGFARRGGVGEGVDGGQRGENG